MRFIFAIALLFTMHASADVLRSDEQQALLETLEQADAARSSDPSTLSKAINRISPVDLHPADFNYYRYLKAYSLYFQGDSVSAVSLLKRIEQEASGDTYFRAVALLTNLYSLQGAWREGLEITTTLTRSLGDITTVRVRSQVLGAMSVFYNQLGDYQSAEFYATQLINTTDIPRLGCAGRGALAEALLNQNRLDALKSVLDEWISYCEQADEAMLVALLHSFLAQAYIDEVRVEDAYQVLSNQLDRVQAINYPALTARVLSQMAKTELLRGELENAKSFASRALAAQPSQVYQPALVMAFDVLYQVSEAQQQYQQALVYLKSYYDSQRQLNDDTEVRERVIQQQRIANLESQTRIDLLGKENALLRTQSELAEQQSSNNRLALALAFTLVLMLLLLTYRSRRLQHRLRRIAETDELTGVANRHHFNKLAKNRIDEANVRNKQMAFVLFDLDHFKDVNDTYGHLTGDLVLKQAINAVRSVCRSDDLIGRMGGEEFAILLPGCSIDKALELAESCRRAIEELCRQTNDLPINLTASFGVADAATTGYEFEALFAGADAALYQSKSMGRNQVYQYAEGQLQTMQPTLA
ncbi:GGDEF domain-containing protein [Aestuariibacter halophilus]|uniref:diguanylate cyclase n=1 Tax=Fluctibacter halophilus TaxID=226011 RepID=A0ABS8G5D2_9ALTE|nr:GGDEF domain-containing protein [Aestuariibacter halophilus]MCC2615802.1 GGDEF domain-containing protein [Aestuariibacter halophilus]